MKLKVILLFIFALTSCESKLPYPWLTDIELEQVFKIAGEKLVLIDFETEWWTWCDRLDVDTFNDDKIKKFANDYLLSIKIDAERGSGPEIAKHFNVRGYPTIIIANNKGYEVDRIVGYLNPDKFLKELHQIKKGKNTISSLLNKFQLNPNNFNTLFNLAKKYEEKGDFASAKRMIKAILAANIDSSGVASFFSILYEAREKEDSKILLNYAENYPESENVKRALSEAMFYIRKKREDHKLESEIFLKLINMDDKVSLNMINSFSWRMSELELNLEIALQKINYAIENVEDIKQKHMFIDTKAELFYKMKNFEFALKEIKKCIKYDPDNEHYNKQFEKIKNHIWL